MAACLIRWRWRVSRMRQPTVVEPPVSCPACDVDDRGLSQSAVPVSRHLCVDGPRRQIRGPTTWSKSATIPLRDPTHSDPFPMLGPDRQNAIVPRHRKRGHFSDALDDIDRPKSHAVEGCKALHSAPIALSPTDSIIWSTRRSTRLYIRSLAIMREC